METCPFCGKQGKTVKYHIWRMHGEGKNHNPSRGYEEGTRSGWNKGKTKQTDDRIAKAADSISKAKKGKAGVGCCSPDYLGSEAHKQSSSKGGGYRENAGRSKKFSVYDSFGNRTTLQSSYEHAVFEILLELGIRWIRPKALKYNGKNYFADFLLVDHNIYLDPKNAHKAKCDFAKIEAVKKENNANVVVILESQITKNYIAWLAQ